MGGGLRFGFIPAVYYLNLDGYTVTAILAHIDLPFTLQSTINQTFDSDLPGNKDFLWNISINYTFSKKSVAVPGL